MTFKRQGTQPGGLFDEQPSVRHVYSHAIPALYARNVKQLTVQDSTRFWAIVIGKVKVGNAVIKRRTAERTHVLIREGIAKIMPQPQRNSGQQQAAVSAAAGWQGVVTVLCSLVHKYLPPYKDY